MALLSLRMHTVSHFITHAPLLKTLILNYNELNKLRK